MELVGDLILVLLAALVGGFLARLIGQPLIVGYILAGVAIGPFTGGLRVSNIHDIENLAELGVALLLFSLGLELSFRELKPVRLVAVAGGLTQIALTMALGALLGRMFGWSWLLAVWFGAAIALSSTMVALKTIQAQGRLGTLSSRVMLGILVVQDLAVVPLMIVLPAVSDPGQGIWDVLLATGRAARSLYAPGQSWNWSATSSSCCWRPSSAASWRAGSASPSSSATSWRAWPSDPSPAG